MQYYFSPKGGVKEKLLLHITVGILLYYIHCIMFRLRTGGGVMEIVGQIYIYLYIICIYENAL